LDSLNLFRKTHWRTNTIGMKSKVHPRYKTKYRVANWPAYERALVQRGDVTLWLAPEAIAGWEPSQSGTRGGQRKYSDVAIEAALTLRLLFHLPLRQTEGFVNSLFAMMSIDLSAPDHTTLSRRSQHLTARLRPVPTGQPLHLIIDSTGLSMVGEGEWAAAKHGGRGTRGWKKLHLGVDAAGAIRAHALTEATVADATTALELLEAVDGGLASVTGDAAYDTVALYEAAGDRGATVVVPPTKAAKVSGRRPRSNARDRTIRKVAQIGRRRWRKVSGYHRQARAENAFFRYKSIIGEALRARSTGGQVAETLLACNVLNQMTTLGRPWSYRIGR
jgi:IS5 family transposase